jgi:hypothetical protein
MADISERMLGAFLIQMMRTGAVDETDIAEAAEALDAKGDEDAAHAMRCLILRANETPDSEWQAQQRRDRFRVIDPD